MTAMLIRLQGAQTKVALAVITLLLAVGALYYPGTSGPYLLDDVNNIVNNKALVMEELGGKSLTEAALSTGSGPLRRPIAMASFALNYYFAGNTAPFSLKLTNIALHLITALGIFLLAGQLLFHFNKGAAPDDVIRQRWIALFIAALWALHPLHVTTVLYTVQRMNGLAGLFTVFAAVVYIKGRERLLRGEAVGLAWAGGAIVIGGTLATLSKENGALLPVLLLAIELTVFRFQTHAAVPPLARRLLIGLLVFPCLAIAGYLVYQWFDAASLFQKRPFSLGERLLTEARVMFLYLQWILLPDIRDMGLFHDDISKSTSLIEPLSTVLSLAGIVALMFVALAGLQRARWRPLSFAILWFLGGHLLESTTIPLELVFEHRNYIPSFGPLFAFGYFLAHAFHGALPIRPAVRVLLVTAVLAYWAGSLHMRAQQWSDLASLYISDLENHPRSARANYVTSELLARTGYYHEALMHTQRAMRLDQTESYYSLASLVIVYALRETPSEELLTEIERALRLNPLQNRAAKQMEYLLHAYAKNSEARYTATTDRVMAAYIRAVLEKTATISRGEAKPYRTHLGMLLRWKAQATSALHPLPPRQISAESALGQALMHFAHQEMAEAAFQIAAIDAARLNAAEQELLEYLKKHLADSYPPVQ